MFLPGQSSPSIDNFLFGPYSLPETCVCTIVKKPAHFRFLGERIDETQFKMSEVCKNISAKKMFQDIQLCLQLFNSISPVCVPIKIMTLLDNFLFGPYFLPEFHLTICEQLSSYPVILCPVTAVPLSKNHTLKKWNPFLLTGTTVPQCPSYKLSPVHTSAHVPLSPAHARSFLNRPLVINVMIIQWWRKESQDEINIHVLIHKLFCTFLYEILCIRRPF